MEELEYNRSLLKKILDKKVLILIFTGIFLRVVMLMYYYYTHSIYPERSWGDVGLNFDHNRLYPPLGAMILDTFRILSFGSIEIFAFWSFIWDLGVVLMFYYVLKAFNVKKAHYALGLFLINPFFFLNNTFSLENCGYHITDTFFFFFLFLALMHYPKEKKYSKYLFYFFLGLSICVKYYTAPALLSIFLKLIFEKKWKEFKIFIFITGSTLLLFLLLPTLIFNQYLADLLTWYSTGKAFPIYIRIIPTITIAMYFIFFRFKSCDIFEIIMISTISMATFMFFSFPYLRWFQIIIFYGILTKKEFLFNLGRRKIKIDNHVLTFYLSFIGVFLAFVFIVLGIK